MGIERCCYASCVDVAALMGARRSFTVFIHKEGGMVSVQGFRAVKWCDWKRGRIFFAYRYIPVLLWLLLLCSTTNQVEPSQLEYYNSSVHRET